MPKVYHFHDFCKDRYFSASYEVIITNHKKSQPAGRSCHNVGADCIRPFTFLRRFFYKTNKTHYFILAGLVCLRVRWHQPVGSGTLSSSTSFLQASRRSPNAFRNWTPVHSQSWKGNTFSARSGQYPLSE